MRRLAERRPELTTEMRRRHMRHPRQRRNVQRLCERPIHRVPGPKHPTVAILDRARHTDRLGLQYRPGILCGMTEKPGSTRALAAARAVALANSVACEDAVVLAAGSNVLVHL